MNTYSSLYGRECRCQVLIRGRTIVFRRLACTKAPWTRKNKKPAACAAGSCTGGCCRLMFARAGRGFLLLLNVFFDELRQALYQATLPADHVQSAFMLMFFQNVVQLSLEFRHRNLRALDSPSPRASAGTNLRLL